MNKENYKKAIDQIHASEELKEKTINKINQQSSKAKILPFKKFLAACAIVTVVFGITAIYLKQNKEEPLNLGQETKKISIVTKNNDNLPRFENIEQLKEVIKNKANDRYYQESEMEIGDTAINATSKDEMAETEKKQSDYSKTNNQVENVDEADIVKTDGEYIYYVANQKVYIIKATELKIISEIKIDEKKEKFYPREIFINKDKLIVLGNKSKYEENVTNYIETTNSKVRYDLAQINSKDTAEAIIYDIANKEKPVKIREVGLDGSYLNSRMIGDNIYFISSKRAYYYDEMPEIGLTPLVKDTASDEQEKYVDCTDIVYFKESENSAYMLVGGFNINNNEPLSVETFFGANDTVYASEKNLYIAQTSYGGYTSSEIKSTIYKFNLNSSKINLQTKAEIKGSLDSQFSMDEYEGNLRVATTSGYDKDSENQLYILNENLEQIGKIENMAKGERIYSVRFMGKTGYIVTFEQIDPLFVIDLSDPTNPIVKGELKIPGYSSYMHPYDETHIIGIGYNTKSNGYGGVTNSNMKMSMFDVSDMENPKEMFNISVGEEEYTYSNVTYNHKALFYNKNKNLIGFPLSTRENNSRYNKNGFVIFKIDLEKGFEKYGEIFNEEIDYRRTIERTIYIGDTLYTLASNNIISYDLITMNKISELKLEQD